MRGFLHGLFLFLGTICVESELLSLLAREGLVK